MDWPWVSIRSAREICTDTERSLGEKKLLQIPVSFNDSPPVLSRLDKQLLAEATYNQFLGLLWSHGFFSDIRHLNDSRCWKPVVWLDSTGPWTSLGAWEIWEFLFVRLNRIIRNMIWLAIIWENLRFTIHHHQPLWISSMDPHFLETPNLSWRSTRILKNVLRYRPGATWEHFSIVCGPIEADIEKSGTFPSPKQQKDQGYQ